MGQQRGAEEGLWGREGIVAQGVQALPAESGAVARRRGLGRRGETGGEAVERDAMVRDTVLDLTDPRADLDLQAHDFPRGPHRALLRTLAGGADHARELPQS